MIHDAAAIAQNRGGFLRDVECAGEIDANDALEFFQRQFLDRAIANDAGIVHENVEAAEPFGDLFHHRFDLLRIGHVAIDHERILQFLRDCFAHPLCSVRQNRRCN